MDKSKDLAILVYSCWKNSDMWPIFLSLFAKYWPDCSYQLILLTDKILSHDKEYAFDDVVVLDATWHDMLVAGIERTGTPYVMLWMDDYLLYDYVNNVDIEHHLKSAVKYHAGNIRFVQTSIMPVNAFEKDKEYDVCEPGQVYSLSTQIGIWDVSFLKKIIRPEWTPWEFERKGSILNRDYSSPLLITKNYIFPYEEVIKQGKWLESGIRLCARENIEIDFKCRKAMSSFETAKFFFMKGILEINPMLIIKIQNAFNREKIKKRKGKRMKTNGGWVEKVSPICYKCLEIAGVIGLDNICFKIGYYFLRKHPTKDVLESKRYYTANKDKIKLISSYLYDEKSKIVFKKMISFRALRDYRKFPEVEKDQYFVKDIVNLTNEEVFIDGGGFTGDTTMEFISRVKDYKRIVVFEPDKKNYGIMKRTLKNQNNVVSYNKGLYCMTTNLSFKGDEGAGSKVDEQGNSNVPVVAIDDIEECRDATFIKMDVEGAEMKALTGAKNTIISNRPKLAICLYHSDADMLDIIEYVHELVPSYKLYVRQHSKGLVETVLYAVP